MYTGVICYNKDGTIRLQPYLIPKQNIKSLRVLRHCFPHLIYGEYGFLEHMLTVSTHFKLVCPHCINTWYMNYAKDINFSGAKQEVLYIRELILDLYKSIAIYKSFCLSEKLYTGASPVMTMSGHSPEDTDVLYDYCERHHAHKYCIVLFKTGRISLWGTAVAEALSGRGVCNFLILATGSEAALCKILNRVLGDGVNNHWHITGLSVDARTQSVISADALAEYCALFIDSCLFYRVWYLPPQHTTVYMRYTTAEPVLNWLRR